MRSAGIISLSSATMVLGLVTALAAQQPAPKAPSAAPPVAATKPAVSHAAGTTPPTAAADYNALVTKYCVGCHSDRNKDRAGSLSLASWDIAKAGQQADVTERMIRKLQASMMPPPGMPRPEPAVYQSFIRTLETTVDTYAK